MMGDAASGSDCEARFGSGAGNRDWFREREVGRLGGGGARKVRELEARGVRTLGDLLEYFPRSYQQERSERPIDQLVADQIQIARGEVVAVDYIPMRPRPRFEATLRDGSGKLALVW